LLKICKDLGITVKLYATKAQTKFIKQASKTIIIKARTLRLRRHILKEYANKCCITAIYILNKILVEVLD
jgi:predicted naringenin-chalcone synthase